MRGDPDGVWDFGQVMDRQDGRLRLQLKEEERKNGGGSWQKKKLEQSRDGERKEFLPFSLLSLSLFVPLTHFTLSMN